MNLVWGNSAVSQSHPLSDQTNENMPDQGSAL